MNKLAVLALLLVTGCAGGVSSAVKKDLEQTIAGGQDMIELCYKQALESNASLQGDIVIKFEIEEGKTDLTKVKVEKTTINEPTFEQCLVQETSELSLSKAPEAKLAVTYPLKFKKIED